MSSNSENYKKLNELIINYHTYILNNHGLYCEKCRYKRYIGNATECDKKYYLDIQASHFLFLLPCLHICCIKCLKENAMKLSNDKECPICNKSYITSEILKLYPFI